MATPTVYRHAPPPIIGTCGVIRDRTFDVFEEELDWLEACGTFGSVSIRPRISQK